LADLARPERESRRSSPSRSEVDLRPRAAPTPAEPASPADHLLALQRSAGNAAVTHLLQREVDAPEGGAAPPVPQETDDEVPPGLGPSRLPELDELLDRFNTPEDEVIDLLGFLGPGDRNTVIEHYRDRLADCLDGGEMIRAVTNLRPPLRTALDWIDTAALITRSIDYDEIRELVTRAPQPEHDAVATDHFRDIFVKICTNRTMITALVDLNLPWATARAWGREEGTRTLDLARGLFRAARLTVDGLEPFLDAVDQGARPAWQYLRNLSDEEVAGLAAHPVAANVISDEFRGGAAPVLRALRGEISSGEVTTSTSETLLAGPTTSPFVAMEFGGDHKFDISYRRDRVDVRVGVELEAVDDRAQLLLAAAKATWLQRIQAAWGSRFRLTNGQREIPLQFQVSLDDGPNHVDVHSGVWAWPNLNAGNWFVPDPVQVPAQAEAVSQAPVHEFGHLIGNADEYNRTAEHYVQVTGQALTSPGTVPETDTAGVTRYTNSLSLMGSGTVVEPRHIDNILNWVNRNLRAGEPAFRVVV
jgi:hypothetical protein